MSTLEDLRKSVHDLTADPDADTLRDCPSIDPGGQVCRPVLVERSRRKTVDESIDRRLRVLGRQTRITMWGVVTMVAFASLEYFGVIGNGETPIWARAIFDGAAMVVGLR